MVRNLTVHWTCTLHWVLFVACMCAWFPPGSPTADRAAAHRRASGLLDDSEFVRRYRAATAAAEERERLADKLEAFCAFQVACSDGEAHLSARACEAAAWETSWGGDSTGGETLRGGAGGAGGRDPRKAKGGLSRADFVQAVLADADLLRCFGFGGDGGGGGGGGEEEEEVNGGEVNKGGGDRGGEGGGEDRGGEVCRATAATEGGGGAIASSGRDPLAGAMAGLVGGNTPEADSAAWLQPPTMLVGRWVNVEGLGPAEVVAFRKVLVGLVFDSKHLVVVPGGNKPVEVLLRRRKMGRWNRGFRFSLIPSPAPALLGPAPNPSRDIDLVRADTKVL